MINESYFLIVVLLLTVGTIFIRGFFIAISGRMNVSPKMRELFTYIPAAIFPALVVPATFYHQGQSQERFLILLAASILCYFVRSTLAVICFGLAMLYLVTHI